MKKLFFFCFALLFFTAGGFILQGKKNTYFADDKLVLSCSAKVDIEIRQSDTLAHMEGRLSLTTLGSKRLALLYTGRLVAPEGRFILSRTLLMEYRYHPENHALELTWDQSNVSETDTVPDEVFYRNLMKSRSFVLYLKRFNENAWLVSGLTTPLYVCNDE